MMNIDIEQIRQLAELAQDKNLAELTVEDGDKSVTIKTPGYLLADQGGLASMTVPAGMSSMSPHMFYGASPASDVVGGSVVIPPAGNTPVADAASQPAPAAAPASDAASASAYTVTAPMVGTLYLAPSPDAANFVEVGQKVTVGQTLCIIEAMKLMNELESEVAGTVTKVLSNNAEPVEFGQSLFVIEPG